MMCPGKEFGITDTVIGAVEGGVFALAYYALGSDMPWWMMTMFIISTLGWFTMAIYCFHFAAKCNCQEIYKNLRIE